MSHARRRLAALVAPAAALAVALGAPAAHAQRLTEREINRLAAQHFRLGSDAFRAGRFAEAAQEFQAVYQLTPQPEMLFNLARAYEAANNVPAAIQTYEAFLERGAPSIGVEQVREWIAALRARQGGATPSPQGAGDASAACAPSAGDSTAAPRTPLLQLRVMRVEYRRSTVNEVGPWVAGAAGLAVGGFAVWQWVGAQDSLALYQQANRGDITWGRDVQRAYDAAPGQFIAAYALTAAGGALVVGSIVWLIARGRGERREVVEAAATPMRGGGFAVAVGGRF